MDCLIIISIIFFEILYHRNQEKLYGFGYFRALETQKLLSRTPKKGKLTSPHSPDLAP